MQEHPLFFQAANKRLFGVEFIPEKSTTDTKTGYIFCHPFAEEKKSTLKVLVDIARVLCKRNHYVFMFDFSGCGDSSGDFSNTSITNWIHDLEEASSFFINKYQIKNLNLLGLRFGCFLGLLFAEKDKEINKLILLEPIFNPEKYLKQVLRKKIIKELHTEGKAKTTRVELFESFKNKDSFIDFDGFKLHSEFYNDLIKYNNRQFDISADITVFSISPNQIKTLDTTKYLKNKKVEYKHVKLVPFWNKVYVDNYQCLIDEIIKTC